MVDHVQNLAAYLLVHVLSNFTLCRVTHKSFHLINFFLVNNFYQVLVLRATQKNLNLVSTLVVFIYTVAED